jgi:sec-independent protein translocase protein TatA
MEGLLSPTHLIFILLIVLIIFGPGKLPELGKGLGKGIREFKDAIRGGIEKPTVSVRLSPSSATVPLNGTLQFTATVVGGASTEVSWGVNGMSGGDAMLGTISSSGLYAAPSLMPPSSSVSVTATSRADPTASAAAAVTITADA